MPDTELGHFWFPFQMNFDLVPIHSMLLETFHCPSTPLQYLKSRLLFYFPVLGWGALSVPICVHPHTPVYMEKTENSRGLCQFPTLFFFFFKDEVSL